jgi:putative phage-type endonuclease
MISEKIRLERRTGIGGSDVAAVLGLSGWKTPVEVWLDKTGKATKETPESEQMYFGNRLESIIAQEYAHRNNVQIEEPKEMYRHKEYPFLIANPDRLIVGTNGLLECKNVGFNRSDDSGRKMWGAEGTDEIPTPYLLQVAHYRYVMDADYVDIAMLLGGNSFRQYRYTKNEVLEEKMQKSLIEFWTENVLPQKEPKMKTRRDVEALVTPSEAVIEADRFLLANLERLSEFQKDQEKLEEQIKKIKDEICVAMGESSVVVDGRGEKICTYKNVASKRFDSATFKKEHGDEYAKYLKESVSRVLRMNQAYGFNG